MSYFRSLGDGPVTDPCQVDPSLCPAPAPSAGASGGSALDWLVNLIKTDVAAAASTTPTPASGGSNTTLLLGAAAVAAYFLLRKKRR